MNIFKYLYHKLWNTTSHSKTETSPIPISKPTVQTAVQDSDRYATKWYDVDYNLANPNYKAKVVAPRPPPMQTVSRNTKAPLAPKTVKPARPIVASPRNRVGTSGIDADDVVDLAVTVATVINNARNAESYTTPTNRGDDDDHRRNSYVSPSIVDSWSSSSTSSSSPSYSSSDSSSSYSSCDTGSSSSSSSCDTGSF